MHIDAIFKRDYPKYMYAALMLTFVLNLAICRISEAVYVYSGMNFNNDTCNRPFWLNQWAKMIIR